MMTTLEYQSGIETSSFPYQENGSSDDDFVQITSVGARDGIQNLKNQLGERVILDLETRAKFIETMHEAGVPDIEYDGFTNHDSFQKSDKLAERIRRIIENPKQIISTIAGSRFHMQEAIKAGLRNIAVIGSASHAFAQANMNYAAGLDDNQFKEKVLGYFEKMIKIIKEHNEKSENKDDQISSAAYLSASLDNEVKINVKGQQLKDQPSAELVLEFVNQLINMGYETVILCDSTGTATPESVDERLKYLINKNVSPNKLRLHLHGKNTGKLLEIVDVALKHGIRKFDASTIEGGCSSLKKKETARNLDMLSLLNHLHSNGYKTRKLDNGQLDCINESLVTKAQQHIRNAAQEAGAVLNLAA